MATEGHPNEEVTPQQIPLASLAQVEERITATITGAMTEHIRQAVRAEMARLVATPATVTTTTSTPVDIEAQVAAMVAEQRELQQLQCLLLEIFQWTLEVIN